MKSLKNYFNQTNEDVFDVDLDSSWESQIIGTKIKSEDGIDIDNWIVTSVNGKTVNFEYCYDKNTEGPRKNLYISEINEFFDKFPKFDKKYHFDNNVNIVFDEDLNIKNFEIESAGNIQIISASNKCDLNKSLIKANIIYFKYDDLMLSNVTIEANETVQFALDGDYLSRPCIKGVNFKVKSNVILCNMSITKFSNNNKIIKILNQEEIPEPYNNFKFNTLIYRFYIRGHFFNDSQARMFAFSKKQFDSHMIKRYLYSEPEKQNDNYYFFKKSNTQKICFVDQIINMIMQT